MTEGPVRSEPAPPAAHTVPARLIAVVQELSLARDLPTIQAIVRREARALTGADGATFVLRDAGQCYYADEDAIAPLWKGRRFPMETCISGWSMLNRASAVIPDIYTDARIPAEAYRPTFVKSLVMVPIRQRDPLGAIGNYWARPHHATEQEVAVLQALADSTAIAIENAELYADLERRVDERTQALEAMNEELQAFSYSVSHDLRAPLRAVRGFGQELQEYGPEIPKDAWHCAERMIAGAKAMEYLIEGLLALSHAGRAELQRGPVNLSELAKELLRELTEADPTRHVQIHIQEGLQVQAGDAVLLRTALANLLGNAWKYTRGRESAAIAVEGVQQAGELIVSVQDNGAGFDPAQARKLFSPFQRLHGAEFEGTGIGLSIVQRVIRRHGGRVWAEGEVDQGATIRFAMPLAP